MGAMIRLKCPWCGALFDKRLAEIVRQRKNEGESVRFFCTRRCACLAGNAGRDDLRMRVVKVCPACGGSFGALTGAKSPTYCSRGCASRGSVTEYRRARAREVGGKNLSSDIEVLAASLRSREAWKYRDLREYLEARGEPFVFEFALGSFVFDLCLPRLKMLVEFDGDGHSTPREQAADAKKAQSAELQGWRVVRRAVLVAHIIHPRVLYGLVR